MVRKMTRLEEFLSRFPEADLSLINREEIKWLCCRDLGLVNKCEKNIFCNECWEKEYNK